MKLLVLLLLFGCGNSVSPLYDYERFYDMYQKSIALKSQITQYRGALKEESNIDEKSRLRTELFGIQQACRDLVSIYNSDSSKFNRGYFKSNSLPFRLDPSICE